MDPAKLENALEEKCKNHLWLASILILTTSPTFFNALHLTAFEFLGGNPSFFCKVPELVETNWTKEEIRSISSPGLEKQSCVQYAWNYSMLKEMSFGDAFNYFNVQQKPHTLKCKKHIYDEEVFHQTVISEWDLVCDAMSISSAAQVSLPLGNMIGSIIFGFLSDRFGRKKIFVLSAILIAVSATATAFAISPEMFIILRILAGIGGGGVLDTGFTILMELSVKDYRTLVGTLFQLSSSIGMAYLALAAYFTNNWRQLQLAISVPMVSFIIHFWLCPESPRWLITNGYYDEASKIIGEKYKLDIIQTAQSPPDKPQSILNKIVYFWKENFKIFSSLELAKRLFISSYSWFARSLYYFVVALNGSNIDVDEYLYIGVGGVFEIPGLLLCILLLKYFGRRVINIGLPIVASATLMLTIVIPKGLPIMYVSIFGKMVSASASGVSMIYSSELFPTEHRNFAIGFCNTFSLMGPLLAPFIVKILGEKAWWMPTTVCSFLTLVSALLLMLLPETKYAPMPDKANEINSKLSKE